MKGGVIDSTRNGHRDTRCPSAMHLTMVWEDTVAHSEGTTGVWTAVNEAVGSTRLSRMNGVTACLPETTSRLILGTGTWADSSIPYLDLKVPSDAVPGLVG
ncbi:hypothetical protein TNCV_4979231 [Trichonephila clavipes]|nr:hypothetical protein TNCV_4979231 [Trichonephila clavipes]